MIRLIFSDMDGTLLDENGKLPAGFGAMYERLKERGIRFAPASGRQYASLMQTFAAWRDELIFVAENGTMVMEHDRELFSSPVDRALALDVMRTGEQIGGVRSVLCGKKQGYLHSADDAPEFRAELAKYVSQSAVVEDFASVDDLPIKMSFCDFTGHAQEKILPVMQAYADRLQVSLSSTEWVDLYNLGVSKGVAARQIQARLGIAPDECAAFGDYENDLDLMDAVTHSFAMENAIPAVKERARHMAPSNSADGVMAVCERILAGEFD
ncbi:HAD family hydrolase [Selenomonas timonae]|uniref:HAD family hydrolase n=1 Tax=Selenomonas timonae TaxID=2754044 RepID=A0A7G7VM72_9FIRM|nr:HAD family hydrolase [Selenomonas timonae]QNH55215.1 HAD family hydrolase [Selenomonas timonae]